MEGSLALYEKLSDLGEDTSKIAIPKSYRKAHRVLQTFCGTP